MNSEKHDIIKTEFDPYIIKWGRFTNLLGIALVFVPCVLLLVIGARPSWSAVLAGVLMQVSVSGAYYVVEPISYFATLGMSGTYMSFLSGNISNMRVPCARVAQEAANVEPCSDEGSIISTIGVAVSVVVNALILTIAIIFGSTLLAALPAQISVMFNYLLPALFASMLATAVISDRRIACIGVPLGGIMTLAYKLGWLAFIPSAVQVAVVLMVSVFGTIAIGLMLDNKKNQKEGE